MRSSIAVIFALALVACAFGQKSEAPLASAKGLNFTVDSLPEEAQKLFRGKEAMVAAERSRLFALFVREKLIELEAASQKIGPSDLRISELKKAPAPTEREIESVFEANRSVFEGRPLEQVRFQISSFLRENSEEKRLKELTEELKAKQKYTAGKDVNGLDLKPADVIFAAGGKQFTSAQFIDRFGPHLYDIDAAIIDHLRGDLENVIFTALITAEAKERDQTAGELIAAEITDKLRDFSDEERARLEDGLRNTLFRKYSVRILLDEPAPVAHKVSADDDPARGRPDAPVTIIMFSDFQCSACAATHPILKQMINEYGAKIHFVVRDFPLESIHENAFRAALAANAAGQQGKFFEYVDVLYRNQDDLDTASLKRYAAELGLNLKQFEGDFNSEKAAAEVRKDIDDGLFHGARGTPTIFVNGVKVSRLSSEGIRTAIERALKNAVAK